MRLGCWSFLVIVLGLFLLLSISSCAIAQQNNNFTAYYINVGQGDSELVQFHGHNILIDGGEPNEGSTVVSFLRDHGVTKLDLVVNTHPDADHLGGLDDVINSLPVSEILNDGLTDTTKTYKTFISDVSRDNIPDQVEYAGNTINLDPTVTINVYSPPSNHLGTDTNTNSIVLKFTYGKESFLFVGDSTTQTENYMESAGDNLRADVLKVGHHGSDTSSSQVFLNDVKPEIAVIEVGLNNEYHLPDADIISRLTADGATVYRTDQDGTIMITTDGNTLTTTVNGQSISQEPSSATVATPSKQPVMQSTTPIATLTPISVTITPAPVMPTQEPQTSDPTGSICFIVALLVLIILVVWIIVLMLRRKKKK